MTLAFSDAIYVQAFPRECTHVFLEGHSRAFAFFGGIPTRVSYDNTRIALVKIVDIRERQVTREFSRSTSHCLIEVHFYLVRRVN